MVEVAEEEFLNKEAFAKSSFALDVWVYYTKQTVATITVTLIAASGFMIFAHLAVWELFILVFLYWL